MSDDFTRRLYRFPRKKKKKKKRGKKSIPCFPKLSLGLGLKRSHYSRKDYRDERVGHSAVPFPEKQVVVSLDYMCLAAFHLTRRRKNGGREGVARTEEHCRAARLGFTRNIDSICEEWPLFLSLSLSLSRILFAPFIQSSSRWYCISHCWRAAGP